MPPPPEEPPPEEEDGPPKTEYEQLQWKVNATTDEVNIANGIIIIQFTLIRV